MEDSIFRITELEEQILFENGHIVFDTSALLSFYGYTDKISDVYFTKLFKELSGRLWLPAQVIYEFEKNREKVIKKPKGEYNNLIKKNNGNEGGFLEAMNKMIGNFTNNSTGVSGQLKALTEKTEKDNKHPHLKQESINEFKKNLERFNTEIETLKKGYEKLVIATKSQVAHKIKEIEAKSTNDNLRERINEFFKHGNSYSYDKMLEIVREGKFRYENEIPPGYKDEDEKVGFQMYGDLLLWFQIIDYAKENNRPIIFVTNDTKEDWWFQEKGQKNNVVPRHELLFEFKDKTKQKIWFYTTDNLIFKSNLYLKTGIADKVIEEVKIANTQNKRFSETDWLELLQEALDEGEEIKASHRYKFKGISIGTWLTGVAQRNKEGKKLKLRKDIEALGFDYNARGRNPEALCQRFIKRLFLDENPNKMNYQNWFNGTIVLKKDSILPETISELNQVWRLKFDEERHWIIPSKIKDKVSEWKKYRYNSDKNPKNKWSTNGIEMGDPLYTWVLRRKKEPDFFKLVIDQFNETELDELRIEGFQVD